MLFNSQAYLLFFAVVFTVYWLLPWRQPRIWLLVVASFVFYAFWSRQLALLVASTTVIDYLLARGLDHWSRQGVRRLLLGVSLTMNLGLLCYFKYANFFISALKESLANLGSGTNIPYLEVIIPFGISFYTFEAISYSIDVYKKRIVAERSLPNFMLFILFFPHLVAGPIVRARDFLPQAAKPKRFNWLRIQQGVEYFLLGLFKKMVIADNMVIYSDPLFAENSDPSLLSTKTTWLGVFAFAVRIYYDFSGYSDMALGSAYMLGYKLTINFRTPYLSKNISEFWRRWHISLSTWLRDYVYIPLGGSRGSRWATSRNLLITMTLGGLWHGANWSYVVWGMLQGLMLIVHRCFRAYCERRPRLDGVLQTWLGTLMRIALTFICVCVCMVFTQPSLHKAVVMLERMFQIQPGVGMPISSLNLRLIALLVGIAHLLGAAGLWLRFVRRLPPVTLGTCYGLLLSLTLFMNPDASRAFIYFQF